MKIDSGGTVNSVVFKSCKPKSLKNSAIQYYHKLSYRAEQKLFRVMGRPAKRSERQKPNDDQACLSATFPRVDPSPAKPTTIADARAFDDRSGKPAPPSAIPCPPVPRIVVTPAQGDISNPLQVGGLKVPRLDAADPRPDLLRVPAARERRDASSLEADAFLALKFSELGPIDRY